MNEQDTIAAISTATAPAGIGIIRVSGPDAVALCHHLFVNRHDRHVLEQFSPGSFHYGFVTDGKGNRLDEVMAAVMRAPHSYTGEDVVELQAHGGLFNLRRILETVLAAGARLSEPGEFTRRAFLNGRIDLTQAEAVMDIIAADNELALGSARRQLSGAFSSRIREIREKILSETAFIEAALDDPESYALELDSRRIAMRQILTDAEEKIRQLLCHAQEGILIREGIRTAIIGRPNAGKSSIMNLLSGRERAIVSEIPGTTRDTVEEKVRLGDLTLHLIDTAGITEDPERIPDPVERIGMDRARAALDDAALILFVVDASEQVTPEIRSLFSATAGKHRIILYNKTDLLVDPAGSLPPDMADLSEDTPVIFFSALTGAGLEKLRDTVSQMFLGQGTVSDELIVTHVRHRELLAQASAALGHVLTAMNDHLSEDFYTVDLMTAYQALGEIIGEEVGEDLVDEIFSKFCMGK